MKAQMNLLPLLAVISFSAWMGLSSPTSPGATPVADDAAAKVRGGGCGNAWKSQTVACVGTVACGGGASSCSSSSYYLVTNGAGNEVPDKSTTFQCYACTGGTYNCGSTQTLTTSTKACITSTSAGVVGAD